MDTKTEQLTDGEAIGMLRRAAHAVLDTLEMAHSALMKADRNAADATYLERLETELKEAKRPAYGEAPKLRSLHPLYPMWQMVAKLSTSLERILGLTNPEIVAERKLAELKAAERFKQEHATEPVSAAV